ncbi:plexin cytoplasmic region [Ostertagia ostertagi]
MLFRKSDSVVEKMVSKWLAICLYDSISQYQAHKYSTLFKALKYQTERGPVDAVTGNARYTINEAKLLREIVDCSSVDCLVMTLDGCGPFTVRAIACDTISQLKQKILDHIYKRTPHSQRPTMASFDLGAVTVSNTRTVNVVRLVRTMSVIDERSYQAQYSVSLWHLQPISYRDGSSREEFNRLTRRSLADSGKSSWSSLDRFVSCLSAESFLPLVQSIANADNGKTKENRRKYSEINSRGLPHPSSNQTFLCSKGTVQKYIEDFLESIMFLECSTYPPILKRVFDLLEEEATRNRVSILAGRLDYTNLYILRVWVHLIKNPKILLDVSESISQDGNLSVVAQTLVRYKYLRQNLMSKFNQLKIQMDCFSFSEQSLGAHHQFSLVIRKGGGSSLRRWSSELFRVIRATPPVSKRCSLLTTSAQLNDYHPGYLRLSTCR